MAGSALDRRTRRVCFPATAPSAGPAVRSRYAAQLFRTLEPGGHHASISSCMPSICSSYFADAGFLLRVEQVPKKWAKGPADEWSSDFVYLAERPNPEEL